TVPRRRLVLPGPGWSRPRPEPAGRDRGRGGAQRPAAAGRRAVVRRPAAPPHPVRPTGPRPAGRPRRAAGHRPLARRHPSYPRRHLALGPGHRAAHPAGLTAPPPEPVSFAAAPGLSTRGRPRRERVTFMADGQGAGGVLGAAAQPMVTGRAAWQAQLDELLVREKAHTREGDAIAAARRRLPMVEVDARLPLAGEHGPVPLLDVFEGRRQLFVYYHMWH